MRELYAREHETPWRAEDDWPRLGSVALDALFERACRDVTESLEDLYEGEQ